VSLWPFGEQALLRRQPQGRRVRGRLTDRLLVRRRLLVGNAFPTHGARPARSDEVIDERTVGRR
jgi:hypothetical protein